MTLAPAPAPEPPIVGLLLAEWSSGQDNTEARYWKMPEGIDPLGITALRQGCAELVHNATVIHRFYGTEDSARAFYLGMCRAMVAFEGPRCSIASHKRKREEDK